MNIYSTFNCSGQVVTINNAIENFVYIISFIQEHFDCRLKRYKIALKIFESLLKSLRGIQDRKPSKEDCKLVFDVLEEILNYNLLDEEIKTKNKIACKTCKSIIDKYYR